MSKSDVSISANKAWELLIERYEIKKEVDEKGFMKILANQIKEYKEPRLMAKWDSIESLPKVLRDKKLNILPISRQEYIIGDFLLYETFPELNEPVTKMDRVELPDFESIDIENITSEANAINVMQISGILDDFLGTDKNISTFNGRMGTGKFGFFVNTERGIPIHIDVHDAQCEIDGGYENSDSVVILEAKNVVHEDFHVRQLYYPYRLWRTKVKKPIRLVFSVYSNKIYRLFEYRFNDVNDYSSIELVKTKNYSLQDTSISLDDLIAVRKSTAVIYNDCDSGVPFPQADSFARIISLLENMYNNPMTREQVTELMDFEPRQTDYYYNAGKYIGLFEKNKTEDGQILIELTTVGKKVCELDYKKRQLKLVELILQHQIFAECFDEMIGTASLPERSFVRERIESLGILDKYEMINRRSSSVLSWLKWMYNLTKL